MTPNNAQYISILSTLLKIIGTAIVAHGTLGINGAMWEQISGAVIMLAPVVWDMFRHTDAAAIKVVAANPDVAKVVIKPTATDGTAEVANDPAQPKVVTQ